MQTSDTYRTGNFVSAVLPKGVYAVAYTPRRIVKLTAEKRVSIKNDLGQVFPFQAQYVTARVFTADGYDYSFLKAPAARVLAG